MKNYILILLLFISLTLFSQNIDIINPVKEIGLKNWRMVNDNVMGGISNSTMYINQKQNLIFSGEVSLDNNGGFASCRLGIEKVNLNGIESFKMRVKGDGKTYKFRLSERYGSTNYSSNFKTKNGTWLNIEIPLKNLKPMFMGYYSRSLPKLEIKNIRSIGFQISDKQEGKFNLEIMLVQAVY
ncbi:MAG: CIA30 family protein [Flavobacteriales bacterium]|jgi:NADH dehydrogenase [ubiquinone] 1 alpha subcomplex assembly factor 1|tara:strand:+ start:3405 stop:3953 length:549 start_codon:yes stop_codon:yes gene_type:complete